MTERMTDHHPDLTAICDFLNDASDATPGTNLLPYAERIKAIVIEALAQEAESGPDALTADTGIEELNHGIMVADWLRVHVPEGKA